MDERREGNERERERGGQLRKDEAKRVERRMHVFLMRSKCPNVLPVCS